MAHKLSAPLGTPTRESSSLVNNQDYKHPWLVLALAIVMVSVPIMVMHHFLEKEDFHHFVLMSMIFCLSVQVGNRREK